MNKRIEEKKGIDVKNKNGFQNKNNRVQKKTIGQCRQDRCQGKLKRLITFDLSLEATLRQSCLAR